jgi:hypothetical protein
MIRLYWWRGAPRWGNFGDELSRVLVERLSGQRVAWTPLERADMVAIGSVLEDHLLASGRWSEFRGSIWGAGRMYEAPPIALPLAQVIAVRGRLSLRCLSLGAGQKVTLGDPGLLARELVARLPQKRTAVGFVPHWSERNHPVLKTGLFKHPQVRVIDPCQNVHVVMREIAECQVVLSSSLHGLIVSDALEIPNCWCRLDEREQADQGNSDFKFHDYYSVFSLEGISPRQMSGNESLDEVVAWTERYARPGLAEIQQRLRDAFPWPKALPSRIPASQAAQDSRDAVQASVLSTDTETAASTKVAEAVSDAAVDDPRRCVVLVPVGGSIERKCEEALRELERRGYPVWRVYGFSAIDQGRNQMATDALSQGYRETMWIDSDVVFNPDDVERLRSHRLPLACAIYPKKGRRELAIHVLPGTEKLDFGRSGGLCEIRYAAAGFLHVRREVYQTVQRQLKLPTCNRRFGSAMIPFFHPLIVDELSDPWYLAEDFAFSERARQCGFQILADTSIRLFHVGAYPYGWEEAGAEIRRYHTFSYHLTDGK